MLASPFGLSQVTKFDPPGVAPESEAFGINDSSTISGSVNRSTGFEDESIPLFDFSEPESGYVRSAGGSFQTIDFPATTGITQVRGINNKGAIVGTSDICCGSAVGFIAK